MDALPIRVLLVEDSPVALTILKRILNASPDLAVVGVARNGVEAMELIPKVNPQVICTDFHMPKMNGLELTRRIMEETPCPILVISTSVKAEDTHNVFALLEAGALDVFPKPTTGLASEYEQLGQELINRIKVLAGVKVFTRRAASSPAQRSGSVSTGASFPSAAPASTLATGSAPAPRPPVRSTPILDIRAPRIVAIGASTGGPQTFQEILQALPASFPVPIVCVQHISQGFLQGLVSWLQTSCALSIQIAQEGVLPKAGVVYFAPERHHLQVSCRGYLQFGSSQLVDGHCPSVTVLFQSIAAYYRRAAIAVLLTGMGRDGATGMQAVAQAGGLTIAQDEASCVVFGMPKEAIALGAVQQVLTPPEIALYLLKQFAPIR
ncbi:chemotaxis-specific protein-glutamate methyltransferase CheB [Trichothermofontia sichuanensis B231]|uniref:chemotaxis-specific protein-glutamate methyltransferase CheB n=1 Tax=Trichothermofontia sichuanensis TaxID=3045816 RepID=UPI00224547EA|nr:chemotaxis-specific protein-glutamate methyltransferase CheB [Trichothermofontia sichuanensis]UZQ54812.1 chemotaxis-specific protein-glutamate methyltransferase CheB [Trichothermofontia sichuanensis B231]